MRHLKKKDQTVGTTNNNIIIKPTKVIKVKIKIALSLSTETIHYKRVK